MPPDVPAAVRLRARLGPEVVASILAIVVVVAVAGAVAGGGLSLPHSPTIAAIATPSPAASPAASPAGSSAASPASSAPSPAASPAPVPTARANATARILVQVMDQLLAQRAALEAEASRGRPSVQAIADLLRDINSSLLLQDAPLALLAADPATTDVAARIRAANESAFEVVRRIQQASISNSRAYIAGAAEVVEILAPVATLRAELAVLAGPPASTAP
jgi:hypothetical protein